MVQPRPSLPACALHSLSYLLFATVLVAGATQIDGGRRAGRVVRRLLIGALVVLGAAFAGLTLTSASNVGAPVALEAAAGIGFATMFLFAFGLGVVLFRQHHTRLPGTLFLSIPLLLGLTIAVGVLAPDWHTPPTWRQGSTRGPRLSP